MLRRHATSLALALAALLSANLLACSDDNTDAGALGDAGTLDDAGNNDNDAGNNNNDAGNSNNDAGPTADAGTPCNPLDGTGCAMADNYCVLQAMRDEGQCRTLPAVGMRKQFEQACDATMQNCDVGLTCIQFQGEAGPTCRKVCSQADGSGCMGLVGTSTTGYQCSIAVTGSTRFAFCAPKPPPPPPCNPLNSTCTASQNCAFIDGDGHTGCVPNGTVGLNSPCSAAPCMSPGLCIGLNAMPALCYEPCNPANPVCSTASYTCMGVTLNGTALPFGLCAPP